MSLFAANKRLSRRLTPDHVHEANVFGAYRKIGTILLSHPRVHVVADVGAGSQWQFPDYYKRWYDLKIIGLDIDGTEMVHNPVLDQRIECDVTGDIDLEDASVDLAMVHSGVEHFSDNARFLANMARILRPGGFLLAQFPNRYAPFAIANRLLPKRAAKRLLRVSMGETELLGFTAHYDRTNYSAFSAMAKTAGFDELYYIPGYFSAAYLEFFTPLFLAAYAWDTLGFALGSKVLASYNLFLLQKPSETPDEEPLRLYAWK